MSAFFLDKLHIDVLVSAAIDLASDTMLVPGGHRQTVLTENADEVGKMLWAQNARSVIQLYHRHEPGVVDCINEIVGFYGFEYRPNLCPGLIAKSLECYEHQACETDDYDQTPAYDFASRLARRLIKRVPGYDKAPWGIDLAAQLVSRPQ